jgi:hypothetical protein
MSIDNSDYKIDKSQLLNWLSSSNEEISLVELGRWIQSKTDGKYILVRKDRITATTNSDLSLKNELK